MSADDYHDVHAVVFDVNVYLDVAGLLGPPFSWEKFQELAAQTSVAPLPNHGDRRVDSLRAIAACSGGRFAGQDRLEVWTSDHIDRLVELKATQPLVGDRAEDRGLGWSSDDAQNLLVDLVDELVYEKTEGGSVALVGIEGRPPLDHEDACVFTTAVGAAGDIVPPSIKYCVTRDANFRTAEGLNPNVTVLYPYEFVQLVRRSRRMLAFQDLRRST